MDSMNKNILIIDPIMLEDELNELWMRQRKNRTQAAKVGFENRLAETCGK